MVSESDREQLVTQILEIVREMYSAPHCFCSVDPCRKRAVWCYRRKNTVFCDEHLPPQYTDICHIWFPDLFRLLDQLDEVERDERDVPAPVGPSLWHRLRSG